MNKEEFEKQYCEKSNISLDFYHKHFVTMSCECDGENCQGWAAVSKDSLSIKAHKELYTPIVQVKRKKSKRVRRVNDESYFRDDQEGADEVIDIKTEVRLSSNNNIV